MKVRIAFLLMNIFIAVASGPLAAHAYIRAMMVGGRVLELADDRQLAFRPDGKVKGAWISPNGKWVVYATEAAGRSTTLSLIPSSGKAGGRAIWNSQKIDDPKPGDEFWLVGFTRKGIGLTWSRDSRWIALPARHLTVAPAGVEEDGIAIIDVAHARACPPPSMFFPVMSKGRCRIDSVAWNPDSKRLAGSFRRSFKNDGENVVLLFDTRLDSIQKLFVSPPLSKGYLDLEGWSRGGKSLLISTHEESGNRLSEIPLATGAPVVIERDYDSGERSPDRLFRHMVERSREGVNIESCTTGETVEISKSPASRFLGWAPNSKMFAYRRREVIKDEAHKRTGTLNTLWLGCTETHKLNHMCVALDCDGSQEPTWSSDCAKMAYVRDGRACVAEFTWHPPTSREKLAAGIPLAEDEHKHVMQRSAMQIGKALAMYRDDQDGRVPTSETVMQDLLPYLKALQPDLPLPIGFGDMFGMFRYFPPLPLDQIGSPAETIVGLMDAGYDWQVVLYADGRVKVIPKQ